MGKQVVHHIHAGCAGRVDPDRAVVLGGVVTRVLERVPCGLQEHPMLRIHHPGCLRWHSKEFGVEFVDPVDQRRATDVQRIRQGLLGDPGGRQLALGQRDD